MQHTDKQVAYLQDQLDELFDINDLAEMLAVMVIRMVGLPRVTPDGLASVVPYEAPDVEVGLGILRKLGLVHRAFGETDYTLTRTASRTLVDLGMDR